MTHFMLCHQHISRTYRYFFTFEDTLPHYLLHSVSLINQQPLFIPTSTDLQFLKGRRNFKFLSNTSDNKSLIRDIYSVSLSTQMVDDLFENSCNIYCFEIVANGFLYRMVRHIVGLLLHSMVNFTNMDYLKDYIIFIGA